MCQSEVAYPSALSLMVFANISGFESAEIQEEYARLLTKPLPADALDQIKQVVNRPNKGSDYYYLDKFFDVMEILSSLATRVQTENLQKFMYELVAAYAQSVDELKVLYQKMISDL